MSEEKKCFGAEVCLHVDRTVGKVSFLPSQHQVGRKYQNWCFKVSDESRPLDFTFNVKCFEQEIYKPHEKQIVCLKTFTSKMMKMPFWFIYLIFIYIFFYKIKKRTKKLTSLQDFKKEKEKAIEQTGTTVLASYIYVHDKFTHLNFFKTHSTKWKKKITDKKKKNPHSTVPSISIQWCSVGGQGMKGASETKV